MLSKIKRGKKKMALRQELNKNKKWFVVMAVVILVLTFIVFSFVWIMVYYRNECQRFREKTWRMYEYGNNHVIELNYNGECLKIVASFPEKYQNEKFIRFLNK